MLTTLAIPPVFRSYNGPCPAVKLSSSPNQSQASLRLSGPACYGRRFWKQERSQLFQHARLEGIPIIWQEFAEAFSSKDLVQCVLSCSKEQWKCFLKYFLSFFLDVFKGQFQLTIIKKQSNDLEPVIFLDSKSWMENQ